MEEIKLRDYYHFNAMFLLDFNEMFFFLILTVLVQRNVTLCNLLYVIQIFVKINEDYKCFVGFGKGKDSKVVKRHKEKL